MESPRVFINDIATAVPGTEVNDIFVREGQKFFHDDRKAKLFVRMAKKGQIDSRFSVIPLEASENGPGLLDFYEFGNFPTTAQRMDRYRLEALPLAKKTLEPLARKNDLSSITHVIVTSCTGFYAPGLDIEIVNELGLSSGTERTVIGFMGCYAAFNAMKQARDIVRSDANNKVLMVNLELCTLHLQESRELEPMLGFLIFADGCAASIISSETTGLELDSFTSRMAFDEIDKITWRVGDQGFDMFLSTHVPKAVGRSLPKFSHEILKGQNANDVDMWAFHPGGKSVLDSIQEKLEISDEKMEPSRYVLRNFGNMSSPSVMFVLKELLYDGRKSGSGCAMAFGPGLTIESMKFSKGLM